MTELERRVAHLERELARWRWRTVAGVLAGVVIATLACRNNAHEDKLRVEQLSVGELSVDRNIVVGDRDKPHVALDATSVVVSGNDQQRTAIHAMETTIGDGHVKLDLLAIHDDAVLELKTDDHDLRLAASTGVAPPPTPQIPPQVPIPVPPSPSVPIAPPKTATPQKCDPFNSLHGCAPSTQPAKPIPF